MIILWTRYNDLKFANEIKVFNKDDVHITWQINMPKVGKKDLLVVMGGTNLEVVQNKGLLPKNRTVTSMREKIHTFGDKDTKRMMVTFDINIKDFDYTNYVKFLTDFNLIQRVYESGSLDPQFGDYTWVKDYSHLPQIINDIYNITGKRVRVSCDLETVGLFPWYDDKFIVSISFSIEEGSSELIRFKGVADQPSENGKRWRIWDQIHWLLNDDRVSMVGANLKFDLLWMRVKWGMHCSNFKFDTTLVGSLLDENRSNSLNTHCKIYSPELGGYDDVFNKQFDKSRMDLVDDDSLLFYAGGDTDATLRVCNKQASLLAQSLSQVNFYTKLLHPSSLAFEDMEYEGMLLDVEYYKELQQELFVEMNMLTEKARMLMPPRILAKYKDDFKLSKPAIIKDFMFTHPKGLKLKPKLLTEKSGQPSTAFNHLKMFEDVPRAKAFVAVLKEWTSAQKTESTYVTGFMKHLRPDGRLHPTAILYRGDYGGTDSGTITGRLAFKDPAAQCLPCWVQVLTNYGYRTILDVVEGFESGNKYQVITHDGSWRSLTHVFRNGVKPVYRFNFKSGRVLDCTGNHPLLTDQGFVKAEDIKEGYQVYGINRFNWKNIFKIIGVGVRRIQKQNELLELPMFLRGSDFSKWSEFKVGASKILWVFTRGKQAQTRVCKERNKSLVNLQFMEEPKKALRLSKTRKLQKLWSQGYILLQTVVFICQLFRGYGGSTKRVQYRASRFIKKLLQGKLQVVTERSTEFEQREFQNGNIQRGDKKYEPMGRRIWDTAKDFLLSDESRLGNEESIKASKAGFKLDTIESIELIGNHETYDITIDQSHSFVANDLVVHNTIPKHTKWAKALRKGYTAPEGYCIVAWDYSQGELRVMACVANEQHMLDAYAKGIDMHLKTGAELNGYTLKQALKMKADKHPKIKAIRQGGKAGNFGLIYGISPEGYVIYARDTYDVILTLEESKEQHEKFFEMYPALLTYHAEWKEYAWENGYVQSPLGRVRHLPLIRSKNFKERGKAERQAINCVSDDTEILTVSGWKLVDELEKGEGVLSVNPENQKIELDSLLNINVGQVTDESMFELKHNSISCISTRNHRWLISEVRGRDYHREVVLKDSYSLRLNGMDKIFISGGALQQGETCWTDDQVQLLGWVLTDGHYKNQYSKAGVNWGKHRVGVTQTKKQNLKEIQELFSRLGEHHHRIVERTKQNVWEITCGSSKKIRRLFPDKTLNTKELLRMSHKQRILLFNTMLKGDGSWDTQSGRYRRMTTGTEDRADAFMSLCVLIGQPCRAYCRDMSKYEPKSDKLLNVPKMGLVWSVELVKNTFAQPQYGGKWIQWSGRVWCPTTNNGTWIAKRNGKVFITGNSPIQSTLSDMSQLAFAEFKKKHGYNEYCRFFSMTHDDLKAYVKIDQLDYWVPEVQGIMENLPLTEYFGWEPQLPFLVDPEVGMTLADMVELADYPGQQPSSVLAQVTA